MRPVALRQRGRKGFTLIELLVVIAIIGILVSLLAAGIMPILRKGPEVQTTTEIRQFATALESFKNKFGTYPPSRIYLTNNVNEYVSATQGTIQAESAAYLQQIWPRIDFNPQTTKLDWGNAKGFLTGDQCLVFFLGGMQSNGCLGFATNGKNPTALPSATGELRDGPYFTFDTSRLSAPTSPRPSPFSSSAYVYFDFFNKSMPYAYFSSLKRSNGYNITALTQGLPFGDCPFTAIPPGMSQNAMRPWVVIPYAKNNAVPYQFYNPDTFQIISAGADGIFGAGGFHAPGNPVANSQLPPLPNLPPTDQGADDFSNFAGGRLEAGL